jgi:hypothetical protein
VSKVEPAASAEPGRWLLRFDVPWPDLVRYGPPGFTVYLRIAFLSDAHGRDTAGAQQNLRRALETLARFTTSPSAAFAAIWEGWTGTVRTPEAPRIFIPDRTMLLFTGPVEALRDAPTLAWQIEGDSYQEPHLVWPADRAWCLACEVDEEVEFTVGCDEVAARALAAALPGCVRRVHYADAAPMFRDPE